MSFSRNQLLLEIVTFTGDSVSAVPVIDLANHAETVLATSSSSDICNEMFLFSFEKGFGRQ